MSHSLYNIVIKYKDDMYLYLITDKYLYEM